MRFSYWISKVPDTHSNVILIYFRTQQCLHECSRMLRLYTFIAYLIYSNISHQNSWAGAFFSWKVINVLIPLWYFFRKHCNSANSDSFCCYSERTPHLYSCRKFCPFPQLQLCSRFESVFNIKIPTAETPFKCQHSFNHLAFQIASDCTQHTE
jgi:hypothetical protein